MTSSCLCGKRHSLKEQAPPRPKGGLSPWPKSTPHPRCQAGPCSSLWQLSSYYELSRDAAAVTWGHSQSDINQTVYYSKKKRGLMIWICPCKPTSSHTRANAVMKGAGKARAVPGEGCFPGKLFKQIWEEGPAAQEPLVSRAPQEAAILAAPLPVIEISHLSLTNPLLFH